MLKVFVLAQAVVAMGALAGLVTRARLHLGFSFPLYLLSVAVFSMLFGLWPDDFLKWPVWLTGEAIHGALKVAMALEISGLIFKAFPAARRVGRMGLFFILATAAASITLTKAQGLGQWAGMVAARAQYGSAFLFGWLLGVVLWYRIPLHPLHKAILTAFVPYLLVFTVAIQALSTFGLPVHQYVSYLNVVAFLGVLGLWFWVAWRPDAQTDVHSSVAKTVQPWA